MALIIGGGESSSQPLPSPKGAFISNSGQNEDWHIHIPLPSPEVGVSEYGRIDSPEYALRMKEFTVVAVIYSQPNSQPK